MFRRYIKTTVYVYPRLLSLCMCATVLVDLRIRRIETKAPYIKAPLIWNHKIYVFTN